jgi:two-component system alkaline phosphatase synthesis response regulator PhoP
MSAKILVVDDEQPIVTLLKLHMEQAGFTVIIALDWQEALYKASDEKPDLMILDMMLPDLNSIDIAKQIKLRSSSMPLLMLTPKNMKLNKLPELGLEEINYVTKPFSPREVVARVKAILKTREEHILGDEQHGQLMLGGLVIHPDRYEANFNDKPLELTPKEFKLLVYLTQNKGRILTREKLLSEVWNYEFVGDTRIIDVHISHLRDKIKSSYIKTVRGKGYMLVGPERNS